MVIAYRGKILEEKRWSHHLLEFKLSRLLLETMILLVRCYGFQGAIIATCAKLYQKIPRGLESMPWWHTNFHDFWNPSAFPVIKIPTNPMPVAASDIRHVYKFYPFLGHWMKTCRASSTWFFRPSLRKPTCRFRWNLIYMHLMPGKCNKMA